MVIKKRIYKKETVKEKNRKLVINNCRKKFGCGEYLENNNCSDKSKWLPNRDTVVNNKKYEMLVKDKKKYDLENIGLIEYNIGDDYTLKGSNICGLPDHTTVKLLRYFLYELQKKYSKITKETPILRYRSFRKILKNINLSGGDNYARLRKSLDQLIFTKLCFWNSFYYKNKGRKEYKTIIFSILTDYKIIWYVDKDQKEKIGGCRLWPENLRNIKSVDLYFSNSFINAQRDNYSRKMKLASAMSMTPFTSRVYEIICTKFYKKFIFKIGISKLFEKIGRSLQSKSQGIMLIKQSIKEINKEVKEFYGVGIKDNNFIFSLEE